MGLEQAHTQHPRHGAKLRGMTQPSGKAHSGNSQQGEVVSGEVLISGVDTGPADAERENRTPTEDHARFQPLMHPVQEPEDEDG